MIFFKFKIKLYPSDRNAQYLGLGNRDVQTVLHHIFAECHQVSPPKEPHTPPDPMDLLGFTREAKLGDEDSANLPECHYCVSGSMVAPRRILG